MKIKKAIAIFLIFGIMLVGCTNKNGEILDGNPDNTKLPNNTSETTQETIPEETTEHTEGGDSQENIDDIDDEEENNKDIQNETDEDETEGEEELITPEDKFLDFELLKGLDNTKKSWWIRLNNENKPTEVPDDILELITKYDGIYLGDTDEKVIYLTFDEGYENGYTPMILDSLKKYDVKSVFFVTDSYVKRNRELIERMLSEGHEVGHHTITHPSLPDIDDEQLEKELLGFEKTFYEEFGVGFKFMRPPSGEYSERVLAAAQMLGYKTVFWSFAYRDWDVNDQKGADYAYNKVMDNLHNGAIILLHAVSKDNAEAMDRIIEGILERGYEIRQLEY